MPPSRLRLPPALARRLRPLLRRWRTLLVTIAPALMVGRRSGWILLGTAGVIALLQPPSWRLTGVVVPGAAELPVPLPPDSLGGRIVAGRLRLSETRWSMTHQQLAHGLPAGRIRLDGVVVQRAGVVSLVPANGAPPMGVEVDGRRVTTIEPGGVRWTWVRDEAIVGRIWRWIAG